VPKPIRKHKSMSSFKPKNIGVGSAILHHLPPWVASNVLAKFAKAHNYVSKM